MKMAAKMSGGLPTGLLLFFLVLVMIQVGEAILQDMPSTDTKCVCQEINSNVDIISEDHSTISVKVTSPYNKNININVDRSKTSQKEKTEGMEVEIKKLKSTVKAINENLLKLISGDANVITLSAKTNSIDYTECENELDNSYVQCNDGDCFHYYLCFSSILFGGIHTDG